MKKITLATLADATAQEVFDQVAAHLLAQGEESRLYPETVAETCAYRGENGLMCAAGCLIGDDEYENSWEGKAWDDLVLSGVAPYIHADLIQALQGIHDGIDAPYWGNELRILANEYALSTDKL